MQRQKKNTGNFNRGECLGSPRPHKAYRPEIKRTFFTCANKLVMTIFRCQIKSVMAQFEAERIFAFDG